MNIFKSTLIKRQSRSVNIHIAQIPFSQTANRFGDQKSRGFKRMCRTEQYYTVSSSIWCEGEWRNHEIFRSNYILLLCIQTILFACSTNNLHTQTITLKEQQNGTFYKNLYYYMQDPSRKGDLTKGNSGTLEYPESSKSHFVEFLNFFSLKDNEEGVVKVHYMDPADPYAFFMESKSIAYYAQRRCNVTKIGSELDDKNYGIGMRKGIFLVT